MINTESQEKNENGSRSNEIASKFTAAQNVIKKKFEEALMNRLEHERNVNHTIKQTSNSTAIDAPGINECNPNELCIKLKSLIDASNRSEDKKIHNTEINSIIAKLYDLNILV